MVAMHQLAALCIATTTLAFVPPQGYKPSHCLRATAPEGAPTSRNFGARTPSQLLRVGANGVKESHRNSLVELLEAHPYVCVKERREGRGCGGRGGGRWASGRRRVKGLLTKSNSVLYGKPGMSSSAQKTKTLQVDPADIGKIIGKGGETVRGSSWTTAPATQTLLTTGCVTITGGDEAQVDARGADRGACRRRFSKLANPPQAG